MTSTRMPVLYVPHGGGPWPFVDLGDFFPRDEIESLRDYFASLPEKLPRPRAVLAVSAHWEAPVPTVMTAAHPSILYDYYGFPPEAYAIEWPAPGDPALAERVIELLGRADIRAAGDAERGFDHGTFIPLKVSWPTADIPTLQLSLKEGLDPATHLAMGRALAPLRDEGVLILGSGMSFHNLPALRSGSARAGSQTFDAWLREAATAEPETRDNHLVAWGSAPLAREAHPREEHLLPLMVVAGAAGDDIGRTTFNGDFARARISAFQYG
jgi:aromatic ring-opening dioxygenase catalytic subunit (LigB family)